MQPGGFIGPYRVESLLGVGGMGEVYRARDTKLNRDVAIKILPPAFANDSDRLARFKREAQVLASLNHPNIAHIYGLETSDGITALVMELVEGPTLADRLAKGAVSLAEALPVARQIAEALEVAHERGIIHRDLKPANIKVRSDGMVKVLDFGLAKVLEPATGVAVDVSALPTITSPAMTVSGVILGTAAYMSPEQARGTPADRRADIFSFGAVLFEMLAGQQPFPGESVSDTLASVLKVDPDWSQLPAATPAAVRAMLTRCLVKDSKRRLQAIGEARIVLENPLTREDVSVARPGPRSSALPGSAVTVLVIALCGAALWGWLRRAPAERHSVLRFVETLDVSNSPGGLALSRDGSRLAFVSGSDRSIYVRLMDQPDARRLPNTEQASFLCFSPDESWISFIAGEGDFFQLKKVPVTGGTVQSLAGAATRGVGPPTQHWAEDDHIYFDPVGTLQRVPSQGGPPEMLATPDRKANEQYYFAPQLLPGGNELLVNVQYGPGFNASRAVVIDLRTRDKKVLLDRAGLVQYVPSRDGAGLGHLLYYDASSGSLLAAPFDAQRLQVQGPPVAVIDGIQSMNGPFGKFSVSNAGMLAYSPGAAFNSSSRSLIWVDRQGHEEPTLAPIRPYSFPRLSPGGDRVAVEVEDSDDATKSHIMIYDAAQNTLSPLVFQDSAQDREISPVWTPDGQHVVYASIQSPDRTILVSAPIDHSGPPALLGEVTEPRRPDSVSRDGVIIGYYPSTGAGPAWRQSLSAPGPTKPTAFLSASSRKTSVVLSPDGHWVAFASNESGASGSQVYVTAYPEPGPLLQISTDGGTTPRWRSDGQELFYFNRRDRASVKAMAVEIELGATLHVSTPKMLFEGRYLNNGYDVSPDGLRFLVAKPNSSTQQNSPNQLTFIVNWFAELQQRVPTR